MAASLFTANNASQRSTVWTTDKGRFATSGVAIHYQIGNSSVSATSSDEIIPANYMVDRYIGVGNYIAILKTAESSNAVVSISPVGAATSSS